MTTKPKSSIALAPPAIDRRSLVCDLGTAAVAGGFPSPLSAPTFPSIRLAGAAPRARGSRNGAIAVDV